MAQNDQIKEEKKIARRTLIRVGVGLFLFGIGAYGLGKKIGQLETTNRIQDQILHVIVDAKSSNPAPTTTVES